MKGWFKPAVTENGVTQETFSLHVCYMAANEELTADQKKAIYKDGKKVTIKFFVNNTT